MLLTFPEIFTFEIGKKSSFVPEIFTFQIGKKRSFVPEILTLKFETKTKPLKQEEGRCFKLFVEEVHGLAAAVSSSLLKTTSPSRKRKHPGAPRAKEAMSQSQSSWRFYRSRPEFDQLIGSLDERGIKEKALKQALLAQLPLLEPYLQLEAPPPPPGDEWLTQGPYIGTRCLLHFKNIGDSGATVTHYVPAAGEDAALWHVRHDDGDEEDLDEQEVKDAIQRHLSARHDNLQSCDGPFLHWQNSLGKARMRSSLSGLFALRCRLQSLLDDLLDADELLKSVPHATKEDVVSAWTGEIKRVADQRACTELLQRLERTLNRGYTLSLNQEDDVIMTDTETGQSILDENFLWTDKDIRGEWHAYIEQGSTFPRLTIALALLRDRLGALGLMTK